MLGAILLGLGGLFVIGGTGSLLAVGEGEKAAAEFRQTIAQGGDPAQAFARADEVIDKLAKERHAERLAQGIIGVVAVVGCAGGLTVAEIVADGGGNRMGRRLGWGAGMLGGALMLGDALLLEQPVDTLTHIWREDPSLNQYQDRRFRPSLKLNNEGAFLSLSGAL